MALLCTNFRRVASHSPSLPNSCSSNNNHSNNKNHSSNNNNHSRGSSHSSRQQHVLTAPVQCCRFNARAPSAGSGASCRLISHLGHPAQPTGTPITTTTTTKKAATCPAGELVIMAAPAANCSKELEPVLGEVSAPARGVGTFIASLTAFAGGLLGSAGNSARGAIQGGGGGGSKVGGDQKLGSLKDLLRLGCGALFTPADAGTTTASSGGVWWPQYFPAMQDVFAGVATLVGALALIQVFNELAKRNVLDKKLSRKLVHIGVGLTFMLYWPLYTSSTIAPYLAAFAPGINGVRVFLIGSGLMDDDSIVKSMTREGDRRELLKGPLYYVLTVVITTVGFWRTSPVGIVALINLCAGDGFADIIGRNFGAIKLPYNQYKSVAGTVGFFVMSSLVSMLYLSYFSAFGFLKILPGTFLGVLLVSFFTALVESLPISTRLDDNFTVPFAAIALGMLFLPVS